VALPLLALALPLLETLFVLSSVRVTLEFPPRIEPPVAMLPV
jgi:hypothetical protein